MKVAKISLEIFFSNIWKSYYDCFRHVLNLSSYPPTFPIEKSQFFSSTVHDSWKKYELDVGNLWRFAKLTPVMFFLLGFRFCACLESFTTAWNSSWIQTCSQCYFGERPVSHREFLFTPHQMRFWLVLWNSIFLRRKPASISSSQFSFHSHRHHLPKPARLYLYALNICLDLPLQNPVGRRQIDIFIPKSWSASPRLFVFVTCTALYQPTLGVAS